MPEVRHSALVSDDSLVARIQEGPVFWISERLPDIVCEITYDTGGFVDLSAASLVLLRINKFRRRTNLAVMQGTGTNVTPTKGQQRFVMTTASSLAAGSINNSSDPVTFSVTASTGSRFPASNFYIQIDSEILLCTARTVDSLVCTRAQQGTSIASHSSGALVADVAVPFTSSGKYVAQITATFGSKTHRSQRFLITVEESVV